MSEWIGKKTLELSHMPYAQEDWGMVLCGDALLTLADIKAGTIDLVLTSPPYLEKSMFGIERSIYFSAVLDQFKRVLKPSGIMWINFNDFYKAGRTDRENGDNIASAMLSLIRASSPDDGIVLDPFMGLGAVGIAAQRVDRKFIGIDISKDACEAVAHKLSNNLFS